MLRRETGKKRSIDWPYIDRVPLKTLKVSSPRKRDTEGGRSQSIKINTMDPRFRGDDTVNRGAPLKVGLMHNARHLRLRGMKQEAIQKSHNRENWIATPPSEARNDIVGKF